MSQVKDLTEQVTPDADDLLYLVHDPAGSPVPRKVKWSSLPGGTVPTAGVQFAATDKLLGRATAGAGSGEEITLTAAGRAILDDATAAAQRVTLGASPYYAGAGLVCGCYGDGNPQTLLAMIQDGGFTSVSPDTMGTTVARCASFTVPKDLTFNRIRFYGAGTTTGALFVAIYRMSDLARLATVGPFDTTTSTWGSLGSGLNVTLTAGTVYFVAYSSDNSGTGLTSRGVCCFTTTATTTTGLIGAAPADLPGNLAGLPGQIFQFAVTAGALPDPAPALAAQAAWSDGMGAFWLDNSDT